MIEIECMTTEEAIIKCLEEDESFAGKAIAAQDGTTVHIKFSYEFDAPAVYVKAVMLEWVKRKLEATPTHAKFSEENTATDWPSLDLEKGEPYEKE